MLHARNIEKFEKLAAIITAIDPHVHHCLHEKAKRKSVIFALLCGHLALCLPGAFGPESAIVSAFSNAGSRFENNFME